MNPACDVYQAMCTVKNVTSNWVDVSVASAQS